jgi:hypothetical protein
LHTTTTALTTNHHYYDNKITIKKPIHQTKPNSKSKVGYFYEFQGNFEKMGRYYRMAYDHLSELRQSMPPQALVTSVTSGGGNSGSGGSSGSGSSSGGAVVSSVSSASASGGGGGVAHAWAAQRKVKRGTSQGTCLQLVCVCPVRR